jgi:hypothetical protein
VALWNTRQDQQVDRNPAGLLENFRQTERDGIDLEGHWSLTRDTRVLANFSHVKARILEPATPGADRIPNVPENTATLGLDTAVAAGGAPLTLSFAVNFVSAQSLTPDDSLRTRPYQRITARAAYVLPWWQGAVVSLNLLGYTRRHEEPAFDFGGGVVGISPRAPLQATFGLQVPL